MMFESIVTVPLRVIARPWRLAPALKVTLSQATMVPLIELFVPIVAELPTWK